MQRQHNAQADWLGGESASDKSGALSEWARFLQRAQSLSLRLSLPSAPAERWLRHVVTFLTVVALGYVCARLFWALFYGATLPVTMQPQAVGAATVGQQPKPSNYYTIFTTFDPFSRRAVTTAVSQTTIAPETNLDLKLYGLRAGASESAGSAIIKTPDNRQASYAVGDQVMSGVVLRSVLSDRAIISRNGVRESLSLNPDESAGARLIQPSQVSAPSAPPSAVGGFSTLLEQLELRPRVLNGGVNGFYVDVDGAQPTLLDSVGLRPADVILAVNDVRLVSMERVTDVIDEISGTTSISVLIERDGAEKTLTLEQAGR